MNDQPTRLPDEDGDAGEPIPQLAALRESPDDRFLDRVRGSIHRRLFASHTVDFSLMAFFQAMLDYLELILTGFTAPGGNKRKPD